MPSRKRDRSPSPGSFATAHTDAAGEEDEETMLIMPIGAGNEVGRSCIVLKYMGKTIMLDCGIHPGYNGIAALPFFDAIDPSEIDLLLITHFHLDHAASLPYFTEKTGFKGRIFCTHPTKAVMRMLLADYIRLVNVHTEDILYDEKDLNKCIDKVELIDYHQVLEHEGIKFWCYNAGHVLGAAMFMMEIAGVHVLYTGDYSMEDDRHLMAAEMPSTSPDVLIVESTYGVQVHSPREDREARFTGAVSRTVKRGGRCLIPVFALGRAQELLLILDEYWQAHRELHHIPIYYASRLASKAIRVYQTYINMMNEHIRQQMDVANPFKFQHITNLKSIEHFDDSGPSVVFASPGMLQSGVSRQLFDRWCTEERNLVLIPGYSVEGTLARKIQTSPEEVTGMDGRVRPLKCAVEYISFSAHVDFVQNKSFIDGVQPANIILVHGEEGGMGRLKAELDKKFGALPKDGRPLVFNPKNCQEVKMVFHREKLAKAVGVLTQSLGVEEGDDGGGDGKTSVHGLLVNERFTSRFMARGDVDKYTLLKVGGVWQRLAVPYFSSMEVLRSFVGEVYAEENIICTEGKEGLEGMGHEGAIPGVSTLVVHGVVRASLPVRGPARTKLLLEWEASPANDMIADSIVALAAQAQLSPGGITLTTGPHHHHHKHRQAPIGVHEGVQDSSGVSRVDVHAPSASLSPSESRDSLGLAKEKTSEGGGGREVDTSEGGMKEVEVVEGKEEVVVVELSEKKMGVARVAAEDSTLGGGVVDKKAGGTEGVASSGDKDLEEDGMEGEKEEGVGSGGGGEQGDAAREVGIRAVALCLVRCVLEDTFGVKAVGEDKGNGELCMEVDGVVVRFQVVVEPRSVVEVQSSTGGVSEAGTQSGKGMEVGGVAWRCDVVVESGPEVPRAQVEVLRTQVEVLVERLRQAVCKG